MQGPTVWALRAPAAQDGMRIHRPHRGTEPADAPAPQDTQARVLGPHGDGSKCVVGCREEKQGRTKEWGRQRACKEREDTAELL